MKKLNPKLEFFILTCAFTFLLLPITLTSAEDLNAKKAKESYEAALSRYNRLKYLEQSQEWDEYFSQGNAYREEIEGNLESVLQATGPDEPLHIYARLLAWQFHQDQQDAFAEDTLSELVSAVGEFAKGAKDIQVVKVVADKLLAYGQKAKAKGLYKIYAEKLASSDIKDEELKNIADNFYRNDNPDLAENFYDLYIERISKSYPREKAVPVLLEIAGMFAYKDSGIRDTDYAEKIFQKAVALSGESGLNEGEMYLRAFNLEKSKEYLKAKGAYEALIKRYPNTGYYDEAVYKIGIISTYVARDIKNGRVYFEKISQKQPLTPQGASSLYQLGLLAQWEEDSVRAKEYYDKLLEKAGDNFSETVKLARIRLGEIAEQKPIEYNLKTFLNVSLKGEYGNLDAARLEISANPYLAKKNDPVKINSTTVSPQNGCLQVELQYLWSGHLGTAEPSFENYSFNTTYIAQGTKEINLVVVSPSGVLERNLDMVDLH